MKRLFRWSTALIAAAMLSVAGGAAAITYAAANDLRTPDQQNEQVEQTEQTEQTEQQQDPAGPDEGPGQTGDHQGDHQDPGDQQDQQSG